MFDLMKSIQQRDPARPSALEVFFAYPGFHAVGLHRVSAFFWSLKLRTLARFCSHIARAITGIEIHPGATIGQRLFIDHGMGVVIGETAVIGDDVLIYHGVTLGGRGGSKPGKRHPTVGNNVMIGAGAQVLGPIHVGDQATIGANAVVVKDVPNECTAVGNPARIVECQQKEHVSYGLPEDENVDPVGDQLQSLIDELETLKKKVSKNTKSLKKPVAEK